MPPASYSLLVPSESTRLQMGLLFSAWSIETNKTGFLWMLDELRRLDLTKMSEQVFPPHHLSLRIRLLNLEGIYSTSSATSRMLPRKLMNSIIVEPRTFDGVPSVPFQGIEIIANSGGIRLMIGNAQMAAADSISIPIRTDILYQMLYLLASRERESEEVLLSAIGEDIETARRILSNDIWYYSPTGKQRAPSLTTISQESLQTMLSSSNAGLRLAAIQAFGRILHTMKDSTS